MRCPHLLSQPAHVVVPSAGQPASAMSLYQVPSAEMFGGNDLPFWAYNGTVVSLALVLSLWIVSLVVRASGNGFVELVVRASRSKQAITLACAVSV